MAEGICLYCKKASGCPLLVDWHGTFDATRLVTKDTLRECLKFEPVMDRERKGVRERAYKLFALGYMRTLHELPELAMAGLRQGEEDELMYENVPDFQDPKLLWSGMTSVEREDVLRYQTDEQGQIIVEIDSEGVAHKMARPAYHIKAYLIDPNGPIKAEKGTAWLWNINQSVEHVIRCEAEAGLVTKVKKPPSATKAAEQLEESETNMAEAKSTRVVRTVRPGGAPAQAPAQQEVRKVSPKAPVEQAPAEEAPPPPTRAPARAPATVGRVANPPQRTVGVPGVSAGIQGRPPPRPAQAPQAGAPVAHAAQAAVSEGVTVDQLEKSVFQLINPMMHEVMAKLNELSLKIDHGATTTKEAITVLHDIASQTGGTFSIKQVDQDNNYVVDENGAFVLEPCPQLFAHPSKIFAYVEGTAFQPIEGAPAGE
jgi:hypothetical protein